MFIPDPEFYPSQISDHRSNKSNNRGGGKNVLSYLFVTTNFTKLCENYYTFEQVKKKILDEGVSCQHKGWGGGGSHVQMILGVNHTFRNECGWTDFPHLSL